MAIEMGTLHEAPMRGLERDDLVIDIFEQARVELIVQLNQLLANEFTLFTRTLNYHWNVTGPRFKSLHDFFETQYRDILEQMDGLAERIRILGDTPTCTLKDIRAGKPLLETPGHFLSADKMINDLLISHLEIQRQIHEIVMLENGVDKGTQDFLTTLLQHHQSMSWMLKSHLV